MQHCLVAHVATLASRIKFFFQSIKLPDFVSTPACIPQLTNRVVFLQEFAGSYYDRPIPVTV